MSNQSKSLIALIGGVAIGATLGILLAPSSGKESRKKVAEAARTAADRVKKGVKSVSHRANSAVAEAEEVL